ncbi:KICSTOR complex protein SZT2-like [Actinia tenebrosa]|uniref:KICSTOR complex protein SZT2-like n=1 Tax=Actinia tenebrosa TaxID=6105 RepID=A0A6P8H7V5_ACTTE|nr:KICSTOR complex protein SZT2-like [Actinia tenebrosa]
MQQYIQFMQSLQFVVVQTRPQSPKPAKGFSSKKLSRRAGHSKTKNNAPADYKKQPLSRTSSDNHRVFHQFLQKTSFGGIMLMELLFQGLYFYVRLYSIDCSRIPSGKNVGPHIIRIFHEDCSHYKDYVHLLSFNYDFHLRQAQSYLSGLQMIFHEGYRIMDLLAEILRRHPDYPGFARNHICKGEIAVPCEPIITSTNVFKYIVKHSTEYDFSTIKINTVVPGEVSSILLGSDQILTSSRHADNTLYTHLRDNKEYDITLAVTLKNSFESSVINMEYYILMTSRRELFPKLSLSHVATATQVEETGNLQHKGSRVRFAQNVSTAPNKNVKRSPERKGKPLLTEAEIQSFHRSASSPHSLNKMVLEIANSSMFQSHSEENIAKKSLSARPHLYSSGAISSLDGRTTREIALLNESSQKAHDLLLHVVCQAQTHCKRDLLWYRLLSGGTGEDDKERKKTREKSEHRKPIPDLAEQWSSRVDVEEFQTEGSTSRRLTIDEFKHLLSIVICKSLNQCDYELVPLLSMNVVWYLNLFRVLIAKFSYLHRLFSDDDGLHYLVLLNPNDLDMFILVFVDESTSKTDIQIVFRSDVGSDKNDELRHLQKPIRDHIYSVLNAVCFHMWGSLLPQ